MIDSLRHFFFGSRTTTEIKLSALGDGGSIYNLRRYSRMSTKFFNNTPDNSLFEKFKGIAHNMLDFHTFQAVVGYFTSTCRMIRKSKCFVRYLMR